jgi:hypothetical protein
VGPGFYQEWANFIYAAKHKKEQNLELCRSLSNNMLYYRVIKSIRKGDQLLAWYSASVEVEVSKSLLNRDCINSSSNNTDLLLMSTNGLSSTAAALTDGKEDIYIFFFL